MAPAEWICSTEGIKDELILLVVGSTSELGTDDYLDLTSPLCSFAISNIFKRRCYYQRTYPEQRRRYVIGKLTGNLTDDGFKIEGLSAFLLFALIAVYFVVGRKYLGSTIWQRVLRA
jgi:hypothetical protein